MKMKTLECLFKDELFDIHYAENELTKALPKMAEKASDAQLAQGFRDHLRETEGQIARIERVYKMLDIKPEKEKCEAIKGLIAETEDLIKHTEEGPVRDAALISAAQKVEHYEIATYGTLIALAKTLGYSDVAAVLEETLNEEKACDDKLTMIATDHVNKDALRKAA